VPPNFSSRRQRFAAAIAVAMVLDEAIRKTEVALAVRDAAALVKTQT
jgi:hypothetical protein